MQYHANTPQSKAHPTNALRLIISIDPAKFNIGITIGVVYEPSVLLILHCDRVAYRNDQFFTTYLSGLIRQYGYPQLPISIVIERQPHSSVIAGNMRYIQGYYTAQGASVVMRQAITHGLHITSYKDRKQYSLQLAISRLRDPMISNPDFLHHQLLSDERKHDIADSFNLLYNEWKR